METVLNNGFCEMSFEEMLLIDGGAWSWKEFWHTTGSSAVGGAIGGSLGGSVTVPVVGSVPGAVAGGVLGAVGGAVGYALFGWW